MIKRFHRQLKAAIKYHSDTWNRALQIVLLGIRSALKEDLECSAAELVYGEPLRLPGKFLIASPPMTLSLRFCYGPAYKNDKFASGSCVAAHASTSFIFKDLQDVSGRRVLQPPCTGPYKVMSRTDKLLDIDIAGKRVTVTGDRVKPAYKAL